MALNIEIDAISSGDIITVSVLDTEDNNDTGTDAQA